MSNTHDREITISRLINAPRERVWSAWTDPDQLILWWGPDGFTNTFQEYAFCVGGVWKFIMHGPDGIDYPNKIVFSEIREPEHIAFTHSGADDDPTIFESSVTFEDQDGGTLVTLRNVFETSEERDRVVKEVGAIEGGKQTLGRLDTFVSAH